MIGLSKYFTLCKTKYVIVKHAKNTGDPQKTAISSILETELNNNV